MFNRPDAMADLPLRPGMPLGFIMVERVRLLRYLTLSTMIIVGKEPYSFHPDF